MTNNSAVPVVEIENYGCSVGGPVKVGERFDESSEIL